MSTCTENHQPTRDELLPFEGLHEIDGLCHVRTYERPGCLPVVIAGELDDNPGTKIRKAIPAVARAIQRELFPDGREFVLVEYRPARGGQGARFELVPLAYGAEGALLDDITDLTRCPVRTWPGGRYDAHAVAGVRGEYLRREVAARGYTSVRRMMAMLAQR